MEVTVRYGTAYGRCGNLRYLIQSYVINRPPESGSGLGSGSLLFIKQFKEISEKNKNLKYFIIYYRTGTYLTVYSIFFNSYKYV